jgi:hypothetical protein
LTVLNGVEDHPPKSMHRASATPRQLALRHHQPLTSPSSLPSRHRPYLLSYAFSSLPTSHASKFHVRRSLRLFSVPVSAPAPPRQSSHAATSRFQTIQAAMRASSNTPLTHFHIPLVLCSSLLFQAMPPSLPRYTNRQLTPNLYQPWIRPRSPASLPEGTRALNPALQRGPPRVSA